MMNGKKGEISADDYIDDTYTSNAYVGGIAKVNWEQICSYLCTYSLTSLNTCCKQIHVVLLQSDYLAQQTLFQLLKHSHQSMKLMYESSINGDFDFRYIFHKHSPLILPIFSPSCFTRMRLFKDTTLFQCYSRLMSYNWRLHLNVKYIHLPLFDVHQNVNRFKFRKLNHYEKELFYFSTKYQEDKHRVNCNNEEECEGCGCFYTSNNPTLIVNYNQFIKNLNKFAYYHEWKDIIFDEPRNNTFFLSGGTVLKCLSYLCNDDNPNKQTVQDLDFFACDIDYINFQQKIENIKLKLMANGYTVVETGHVGQYGNLTKSGIRNLFVNFGGNSNALNEKWQNIEKYSHQEHLLLHPTHPLRKQICETWDEIADRRRHAQLLNGLNSEIRRNYNLKCIQNEKEIWKQLQFIHVSKGFEPWSVLHVFDLDCCQVGFNGNKVLATYAFLQSITTQTMLNYKYNQIGLKKLYEKRTLKYSQRNYRIILPKYTYVTDEKTHNWITKNWEFVRGKALQDTFVKNVDNAFALYGDGGFGLNNDCCGVRKTFVDLLCRKFSI